MIWNRGRFLRPATAGGFTPPDPRKVFGRSARPGRVLQACAHCCLGGGGQRLAGLACDGNRWMQAHRD